MTGKMYGLSKYKKAIDMSSKTISQYSQKINESRKNLIIR